MASGVSTMRDCSSLGIPTDGGIRDPLFAIGPSPPDNSTSYVPQATRMPFSFLQWPLAVSQQFQAGTAQTGHGVAAPGGEMQSFWAAPGTYGPVFVPVTFPSASLSDGTEPPWAVPANVSGNGPVVTWSLTPPPTAVPYPPAQGSHRPDVPPGTVLQYTERDYPAWGAISEVSRHVTGNDASRRSGQDATCPPVALPLLAQAAEAFESKVFRVSPSYAREEGLGHATGTTKRRRIQDSRVPDSRHPVIDEESSDFVPNLPNARVFRSSDSSRLYVCAVPRCKALHASISALTHHLSEAHGIQKPYRCEVSNCHQMLTSRAALAMHMKGHAVSKVYRCDVPGCDASFTQSSNLTRHTRVHTGERPFKCTYDGCPSAFAQKSTLVFHLRTHTDERPFPCEYSGCKAAFRLRSALTVHERVHTGERPYACQHPGCGKRFQTNSHLTRHGIVHNR